MEYDRCVIGALSNTHCQFLDCSMIGPLSKSNAAWTVNHSADYHKCRSATDWFELDCNGSPITQVFSDYIGRVKVTNFTHADGVIFVELSSGQAWIDASCTAGSIFIFGQGSVLNESTGVYINTDGLVDPADLTASNLAGSVLAAGDVDGYSLEEAAKIIVAALAGKLSGADGTTISIRDLNDTVDRVVATVDASGNRTGVSLNAT
jgi:hypothetical protein